MKPEIQVKDRRHQRRQRAIALVIVLAMVSMMTIFMLAIFSVSRTEHASSVKYADGQNAKELADMAVNVVMAQIWDGTQRTASNPALWASQPGAIRRYNPNGAFHSGYKLYSSSQMQVTGAETQMIADVPPSDWASQSGVYADINEPVIRPDADGDGVPEIIYPILDPRAYLGANNPDSIEGFSYESGFSGVVPAASLTDLNARLPMPVQWLYILKNGQMGTLSGSGGTSRFVPASSGADSEPSEDNPIVGRIAFWTDDEACKININTAGEPTPWMVPTFLHERDFYFAHFQPMSHEYQRFPGHPATIAMSTVLFPNQPMDLYSYGQLDAGAGYHQILTRKERIFDVMPKINFGGSRAGTVAFWRASDTIVLQEQSSDAAKSVNLLNSINERLYASVDELMFSQQYGGGGSSKRRLIQDDSSVRTRFQAQSGSSGNSAIFTNQRQLERARFFLTAHSRVPEVNMFGQPRVAIWPVAHEGRGPDYRTGYDNLIAFCSSLGTTPAARNANSYYFRRQDYSSPTTDINLPRNMALLNMLVETMGKMMPGGATFTTKYNSGDAAQIMVQIFDYIRSTNLYDGFLAVPREQLVGDGTATGGLEEYRFEYYNTPANRGRFSPASDATNGYADGAFYAYKPPYRTYTPSRMSRMTGNRGVSGQQRTERAVEYSFPGHGSVVPSKSPYGPYRGMGRFPTLTEVGFHFICSADGNPDKGSFSIANRGADGDTKVPWVGHIQAAAQWTPNAPHFQGGRTAAKMKPLRAGTENEIGKALSARAVSSGNRINNEGFLDGERLYWYSNFPPDPLAGAYGTTGGGNPPTGPLTSRSTHPGMNPKNWNRSLPSYNPNTQDLQKISPLRPGMKRVQGQINLELCVPMLGYGPVHPELSIVVTGMKDLTLNGVPLFGEETPDVMVWKSGLDLYHVADNVGTFTSGGYVDAASISYGRRTRLGVRESEGGWQDPAYDISAGSAGNPHLGLRNYDLATRFVTVEGDRMEFGGAPLTFRIYAGHVTTGEPLQTIQVNPPSNVRLPVPELVTISTDYRRMRNTSGTLVTQRRIHAPEWWSLSWRGVFENPGINALDETGNPSDANPMGGRLRNWTAGTYGSDRVALATTATGGSNVPRGTALVFGYDPLSTNHSNPLLVPYNGYHRQDNNASVNIADDVTGDDVVDTKWGDRQGVSYINPGPLRDCRGQDVMFSMVPGHSDVRHIMAMTNVPANLWIPHPMLASMQEQASGSGSNAQRIYFAHNIGRANANANPGYHRGDNNTRLRLVPFANYAAAHVPDVPMDMGVIAQAAQYGDFDNGFGGARDGAWLNKPDEGNAGVSWISMNNETGESGTRRIPTAYFQEEDRGADAGDAYMTPNRMVPSPGMFGSLPSRVIGQQPWRTLLFRPSTPQATSQTNHPGAAPYQGGIAPADHYIMDLFWMPVVEPYAISETFSSAGKININYQIVPFNHIRRATGMHAVLKGEMLAAIPTIDGGRYLGYPPAVHTTRPNQNVGTQGYHYRQPWTDLPAGRLTSPYPINSIQAGLKFWHREIEAGNAANGTLTQFDSRFNHSGADGTPTGAHGLFRTASQICEIYLIPKAVAGQGPDADGSDPGRYNVADMKNADAAGAMAFWARRQLTGDNTRERPYANIYGKISAQSNTFRVFYKAQTIRKARSVAANEFDVSRDRVTSEYRGSTLIERKLDANADYPDYATSSSAPSLDTYYRFRVLETKRFAP